MATQTLKLRFPSLDIQQRPQRSLTSFINYSKQLEEFITKYKTRPRDIKFWPYGPYWPQYFESEILETPKLINTCPDEKEKFHFRFNDQNYPTVESQVTSYTSKWRGVLIVFDSERSSRDHFPNPVPQGCCPSLLFESRFECGNLRQARRVGQFEYELVLKTDLYTNRHTQWYYFRVQNAVPGVTYRFRIDFPNADDTYYLAHCYPYTFTDLKDDLENLLNDSARQHYMQREVLCETRAGNNQPESIQEEKKAVVITGRVHPGESQASWMMRGVLDYITGPSLAAQELRDKFIFKIVPMLNPDGVIVGNYRCSLAARDLNRNYRRPRKESFPTVWSTKDMIEKVMEKHEVALYCDLHGHSRKHNVFMYGNNTSTDDPDNNTNGNGVVGARGFLNERLFPWLMAQKMRILNSFTLEATFSGTAMNKDECRHFNISDYMEMGHILCQCVLEYHNTQENKARQTEIVLEMTRYLTCQVLERRRGVSYKMPNLKAFIKQQEATRAIEEDKNTSSQDQAMDEERSRSVPNEDNSIVAMETVDPVLSDRDEKVKRRDRRVESRNTNNGVNNLSKLDVENLLDTENMKTMDGCLKILAQLNVSEALEESDSSDSDSESEPELKPPPEPKQKKKKRKSKKQRDKEQQDRKGGYLKEKKDNAHFVSKYVGRKNGGIPCFAEERSVERAAKRMAEMKKRGEEEKQREMAFFMKEYLNDTKMEIEIPSSTAQIAMPQVHVKCVEEAGICQCGPNRPAGMPTLRRSLTNDELQRRLQVALNEGTSNIAQTLVGLNTDEDEEFFMEGCRTVRGVVSVQGCVTPQPIEPLDLPKSVSPIIRNELPSRPLPKSYGESMRMPTIVETLAKMKPRAYHSVTLGNAWTCYVPNVRIPHSFRDLAPAVLPATAPQNNNNSLRGPSMKSSMGRQVTNSAQGSLNYGHHAATQLTRSDMSPANDSQRKYEDKKRAPGPLTLFGDHDPIPKFFTPPKEEIKLTSPSPFPRIQRSRSDLNLSKDYMKILLERIKNNPMI
ncbi:CBPC2-like protein [Mya arenaria]|uniref:CBPC2-like protein n=1 Tax=Mya arenaria TaxID=6604 RepID=A0ABY7F3Z3_MYAAR|nr:CBPC2-like protein [Mya arenaria]